MKRNNDEEPNRPTANRAIGWQALVAINLILGAKLMAASDPLDTWHQRPAVPENALAFGNGMYVAVGENGQIWTSPDALGWTSRVSGTTNRLRDVAFGNGTFMAVGDYYTIVTSTNGVDWVAKSSVASFPYVDVVYLYGQF